MKKLKFDKKQRTQALNKFFYALLLQHLKFTSFTQIHIHFFQQIDKHGPHFHNMLKVFSFSQIVFLTLLSFFRYYLFSHFFLLILFYSYIDLFCSILFYSIYSFSFFLLCPAIKPINSTKPFFFFETIKLMTNIKVKDTVKISKN